MASFAHLPLDGVVAVFRDRLARAMGIDPRSFERRGVSLAPTADRMGTGLVSVYRIGPRVAVWCAPDTVGALAAVDPERAVAVERHGAGLLHVLHDAGLRPAAPPIGTTAVALDPDRAEDVERIAAFLGMVGDDDADEAELDLDDLDPVMVAVDDGPTAPMAIAGYRPPGFVADFGDISVITRTDARRAGAGRAAVTALLPRLRSSGRLPLYRCAVDNEASEALCLGLGFRRVAEVTAFRVEPSP